MIMLSKNLYTIQQQQPTVSNLQISWLPNFRQRMGKWMIGGMAGAKRYVDDVLKKHAGKHVNTETCM